MKRRVAKLEILIARNKLFDVSPDLEGLRDQIEAFDSCATFVQR
jgi:hypothetical protein